MYLILQDNTQSKKSIPNVILYGELGRYPINIAVKSRMIGFWQRTIEPRHEKTCLRGLRPGKTQTDLLSYTD